MGEIRLTMTLNLMIVDIQALCIVRCWGTLLETCVLLKKRRRKMQPRKHLSSYRRSNDHVIQIIVLKMSFNSLFSEGVMIMSLFSFTRTCVRIHYWYSIFMVNHGRFQRDNVNYSTLGKVPGKYPFLVIVCKQCQSVNLIALAESLPPSYGCHWSDSRCHWPSCHHNK